LAEGFGIAAFLSEEAYQTDPSLCRLGRSQSACRGSPDSIKISVTHRWLRDFVYAWQRIPALEMAAGGGETPFSKLLPMVAEGNNAVAKDRYILVPIVIRSSA
jgi:hypothetical protein